MVKNCPICGGVLKLRSGKYGEFFGCTNYPKCIYTINIARVNCKSQNAKSKSIQVNDIVKLISINTGEILKYKIVNFYVEYIDIFVGYGKYSAKHNRVIKNVDGGDPNNLINPTISIESPIGKLLIGKQAGDTVSYKNYTYKILEHRKLF